jgi:aspartyl-tRNA(Asn)/glutamyl-tRNA(Gln) amidotransferase subunit B
VSAPGHADWELVIGLEIHAQLRTRTKIFCGCEARFGGEPNSRTCPVCLGLPGALPVLNRRVVDFAVLVGHACGCDIAPRSIMARKNYFYPDLPKGYQISQYERPICSGGTLTIGAGAARRSIRLTRIHIEEDAGKSIHGESGTRVDLNRSGVPLIEIVTEPDLCRPEEAHEFLVRLRQILTYLGVCDGNMEEGSLRCDANISVRPAGSEALGDKTEIKNLNSFRGVAAALRFEGERQIALRTAGGKVEPVTLLWDAAAREARPMRSKEEAHDYRYFPEPDLQPVVVEPERLAELAASLPELPAARRERFGNEYELGDHEADLLSGSRELADYFEDVAGRSGDAKQSANWVMGELLHHLKLSGAPLAAFPLTAPLLAALIGRIAAGRISRSAAKTVFEKLAAEGGSVDGWIEKLGLTQISDPGRIAAAVAEVIAAQPEAVQRYREGEGKLLGFLVGQVMRATGGKANPGEVSRLLADELD